MGLTIDGGGMVLPLEFERAREELVSAFATGAASAESVSYLASGSAKHVYRLGRHPDLVLAVSRTLRQNLLVDQQHALLQELAGEGLRVVQVGPGCFDAPDRRGLTVAGAADRRAFLMRYVNGAHAFPAQGVDADPVQTAARCPLFHRAGQLGILDSPERLATLIGDLEALRDYCAAVGDRFSDLQGLLEAHTGHFYVSDPGLRHRPDRPRRTITVTLLAFLVDAVRAAPEMPAAAREGRPPEVRRSPYRPRVGVPAGPRPPGPRPVPPTRPRGFVTQRLQQLRKAERARVRHHGSV